MLRPRFGVLLFFAALSYVLLAVACGKSQSGAGYVTGVVYFDGDRALPEGAVVKVSLAHIDIADAPATVVGTQSITKAGKSPIEFKVGYKKTDLDPKLRYVVDAWIYDADGRLIYRGGRVAPAVTLGNPVKDLRVETIAINN